MSLDILEVKGWELMLGCCSEDIESDEVVTWQVVALLALGRDIRLAVDLRVGALVLKRSLADVHLHLLILDDYFELYECTGGEAEGAYCPFVLGVDGYLVLILVEHTRGAFVVALEQLIELIIVVRDLVVFSCGCG